MQVIVSARHTELTDGLREEINQQLQRLERFDPRVSRANVTLLEQKTHCEVEALLSVDRADRIHAHADGPDFRTAVARVVDRLSTQLKRLHGRRVEHQAPPIDELAARQAETEEVEER